MCLETAFNLCTISSKAISSFLSQNLILRQNKTILRSCFPLHQKVLHGWGSTGGEGARLRGWGGGGGHGSASLPWIGPQPRQGARPAPGWGLLSGSGSAPAPQVPAATGELRVHRAVTWKPGACTPASPGSLECAHPSPPGSPKYPPPRSPRNPAGAATPAPGNLVCAPRVT